MSNNPLLFVYRYLHGFEEFYRKLGCTMNSPRGPKSRSRPGRSLIRDRDRASGSSTPKCDIDDDDKPKVEVKVEKIEKVEKVEKIEKNEKIEKVEKVHKADKVEEVSPTVTQSTTTGTPTAGL